MTSDEKLSEEVVSVNRDVSSLEAIKDTCQKSATCNVAEIVNEEGIEEKPDQDFSKLSESEQIANDILQSIIASTFWSLETHSSTDNFSFEEKCSYIDDSGIDMTDNYPIPTECREPKNFCAEEKSESALKKMMPYTVFTDNNINNMYGEVKFRRRSNSCQERTSDDFKNVNRKTSIVGDDFEQFSNRKSTSSDSIGNSNRGSLYSVEEYDEEENEEYIINNNNNRHRDPNKISPISAVNTVLVNNSTATVEKEKQKENKARKKSIFSNIFSNKKSNKVSKKSTTLDSPFSSYQSEKPFKISLINAKKYRSAVDIREPQQSLTKRISKLLYKDGSNLIRRSFSFRDLQRKKEKDITREKLAEMKNMEWAASLQSLVESDIGISYDDLSFVNYDVQNSLLAEKIEPLRPHRAILRTQSMYENGYEKSRNCNETRDSSSSVPQHSQSAVELSNSGTDISLIISSEPCHHKEGNVEDTSKISEIKTSDSVSEKSNDPKENWGNSSPPLLSLHLVRKAFTLINIKQNNKKLSLCVILCINFFLQQNIVFVAIVFNLVKSLSSKSLAIARECTPSAAASSDNLSSNDNPYEWRKLVGSIRRKVQRNPTSTNNGEKGGNGSVSRKNSLTKSKFDLFKRETSREEIGIQHRKEKGPTTSKDEGNVPSVSRTSKLVKQKSIELSPSKRNYFRKCYENEKRKSNKVCHSNMDVSANKSTKTDVMLKSNRSSFKNKKSTKQKNQRNVSREDFLAATMRIFLVVSPPGGKIQVRSRSLNHLDKLEMRQSTAYSTESTSLKDSKSEPDCTRSLTILPPKNTLLNDSQASEFKNGRKHVLTRSQKSSSECFSVNFEIGDEPTWDNELFFPAIRGVTLFDSLCKLCELRNIDLLSCEGWLQDRENNTSTRVSFSQDTKILVGRNIVITAKGSSSARQEEAAKKSSSSIKSRTSFNSSVDFPSSSNLNLSHDSRLSVQDFETNKRQCKQRWSGLFSNSKDNSRMEVLAEQLNYYAKYGVPTSQVYPKGQCESIDALYKLENDWKEIIDAEQLCERSQQQQTALWELIKTEVAYIKTLKVVTDLFLACLRDLQSSNLLKEIDTDKLFSNITEILDANVLFWRNSLFPLVRDMRKYKQPPCIENMCEGFLKINDIFQPYFRYCSEQARCQHYCRENHAHNELFTAYLAWCETQRECNRLRLMDILVQPMQRLTKYGLLLKAILRNTDDDVEKDNLNLMIKSVDDFVNNVNFSLKRKQDNERIKGIIARIESYDVVESKDDDVEKLLKNYSRLDLNKPMVGCSPGRRRHLIMEGDLKLKDNTISKTEVHCFLLTDMLLICKPSTKKGGATMRVIRQPYVIDRLVISELNRETPSLACIYKNEFDMAVAAFILQNNDAKKLKVWKESIMKAQSIYSQAKKVNYTMEESLDAEYCADYSLESDYHNVQLAPRSPLAGSSRSSRVSSLAHSHSGSVEINEQSSGNPSHMPSGAETTENRTASISSDDGVQSLPSEKSPVTHKSLFKQRMILKTPNTLSVQPYGTLGQSLPNLTLGSPNVGTLNLNLNQNTLLVPSSTTKNGGHLLSPTHRGISYPPPSPTRGNLKRGLAISQNKNPPLIKTRHVTSTTSGTSGASGAQIPTSFDFDVPIISAISARYESDYLNRDQKRQTLLRNEKGDLRRSCSPGAAEDVPRSENRDFKMHTKPSSWNDNGSKKLRDQT
ncbi:uncharacterized protein LOC108742195 isoform X2 [Agrilus planipennis]|uniref:Uncharacterized protein LOC108742195 isoform X2 n=1 Tax=Agrilus planipennis TaxID=224129 RepID=A0A7F5R4T5_AGRPL|nr:uncharacterized protein LOC108742195 isoform X2 [Agrilus planipennis]